MKNKLAILGKLDTKYKAPFNDDSFDIWSVNKHCDEANIPRVDVWFDLHKEMVKPDADINRENFPFDDVENLLGGNYFNNSISYLIAYAILQGYKEIHLYGMRFNSEGEERHREYQNVRELIFFAKGKGIKVYAPYDNIMIKQYDKYM